MSGRPRNARGLTGRDGGKESDLEAELLGRILDSIRKAKEHNDEAIRVGRAIMELEEEIKGVGRACNVSPDTSSVLTWSRLDS